MADEGAGGGMDGNGGAPSQTFTLLPSQHGFGKGACVVKANARPMADVTRQALPPTHRPPAAEGAAHEEEEGTLQLQLFRTAHLARGAAHAALRLEAVRSDPWKTRGNASSAPLRARSPAAPSTRA